MNSISNIIPNLAVVGGAEILQKNASQAHDINLAWELLWEKMFAEPNLLWLLIVYLASMFVSFTFIAFAIAFISGIISGRLEVSLTNGVWLLAVLFLLSNNAQPIANINLFIRDFTHVQVRNIYEINLVGVEINEAITDILVSADIQQEISNAFSRCGGVVGTEQLECLLDVQQEALAVLDQVRNQYTYAGIDLRGVARLRHRIGSLSVRNKAGLGASVVSPAGTILGGFLKSKEYINPFAAPLGIPVIRAFLKDFQWAILNGIEAALMLTGLYGPIAAALSTVPMGTRAITIWLFGVISLSSVIWSYAILVGFIATVISLSQTELQSELGFLLFLSFGSPLIAYGLAKGGGAALLSAITTTSLMITRITFGLISSLFSLIPLI